jgi:predicted enzyme related to lactoylglutathione lyase
MSDSPAKLVYVVKFVADMDQAVGFYRDTLGLTLKFQSPDWSEFATGDTILALHLASASKAPGTARIGLSVPDLQAFYAEMSARGVTFTMPPTIEGGFRLALFLDSEGSEVGVSEA